ncbi:hypothetical protein [Streptomyces sp. AC1-42T]|uniref:hypothetical protein n=1 Tax=Streptomyces sp. AC1-42T TaxID=2218665 RepID=UPI0011B93719|nr:hypothetical protein [Streptomyces sp. AC1-42T]
MLTSRKLRSAVMSALAVALAGIAFLAAQPGQGQDVRADINWSSADTPTDPAPDVQPAVHDPNWG